MIKILQGSVVVGILVVFSFIFTQNTFAQTPCASIVYLNGTTVLVDDCTNVFSEISGASPIVAVLEGEVLDDGTTVSILGESASSFSFNFHGGAGYTPSLFKHTDETYTELPFSVTYPEDDPTESEYRTAMTGYFADGVDVEKFVQAAVHGDFDTLTAEEKDEFFPFLNYFDEIFYVPRYPAIALGTYSLVFTEQILCVGMNEEIWINTVYSWFIPTAYAQYCQETPKVYTIEFSVVQGEVVPEPEPVDHLILQYAPILYFHPSEDYFPMDVESFVEASSLWSRDDAEGDELIKSRQNLTFQEFESIVDTGINTNDMYLAFSDPDTPRSIDLQRAKSTYVAMEQDDPTVYYHKMTDETDYGKTFTVLQYWYFYAMNNWGEKIGNNFANNHEGDWESTFVFLNEDEEPEYVAYSSHLNDGLPQYLNGQYASVRRGWDSDEVEKNGDKVKGYIALGSHASYFTEGEHEIVKNVGGIIELIDYTSDAINFVVKEESLTDISIDNSFNYEGLWGTYTDTLGGNGPQGPTHINVTSQTRFSEPIKWAGLNNPFKLAVNTATDTIEDTKQGIKMVFDTLLDIGTNLVIERYDEYITFGTNIAQFRPLPFFFEVTSDTDTSGLTMTLSYDPDYLESIGELAENLVILYYNPVTDLVEVLDSVVDTEAHTVTAYTPHMSRYLLGFQEREVVEELEVATTTVQTTRSYGTRVKRPEAKVLGVSTTVGQGHVENITVLVEEIIVLFNKEKDLTEAQRKILTQVLADVLGLLEGV